MNAVRLGLSVVLLTVTLAPLAAGQGPTQAEIQLNGEGPDRIDLDRERLASSFQLVYEYFGPMTTESQTTVHLSVQEKPDWLHIEMPDTVQVPVEPNGTRSVVDQEFGFWAKSAAFPPAFHKEVVEIKIRAEANGAMDGANNTRAFLLDAGYKPVFRVEAPNRPVELAGDEAERATITVTNLGNAPVRPSFRFLRTPDGIQTGVASRGGVIGTPAVGDTSPTREFHVVIKDKGDHDWIRHNILVRTGFVTTRGGDVGTTHDVTIQVVNGFDVADAVVPVGAATLLLVGAVYYYRRHSNRMLGPIRRAWSDD